LPNGVGIDGRCLMAQGTVRPQRIVLLLPRRDDPARVGEQIDNIRDYRGFQLTNQTSLLFSSEPDISLIGRDGGTLGVIEVKGGADPAGTLERYGAAKKSFEDTLRESPNAKMVLVVSCISAEVNSRIQNDPTINIYYNLTQILGDDLTYKAFVNTVFAVLGIPPPAAAKEQPSL